MLARKGFEKSLFGAKSAITVRVGGRKLTGVKLPKQPKPPRSTSA